MEQDKPDNLDEPPDPSGLQIVQILQSQPTRFISEIPQLKFQILQYPRFISDVSQLKKELSKKNIPLSEDEAKDIERVIERYPMRINSYYLSLIKEKGDSIWNQCIPRIDEIENTIGEEDPLNEENGIPFLTHRYPDRCLLIVSNTCAMYCRFCTRKRKVGEVLKNPTRKDILKAISYIKNHKEIRDVILSGGDPFLLGDKFLEDILIELRSRRTRRKLRRRAPLLAGAAAVIAVAAVAALAIWAFMPSRTSGSAGASAAAKTMSPAEIVDKYGPSVVNITTRTPIVVRSALQWKQLSVSGVVVSKDGLVLTSGRPFVTSGIAVWQPVFVTVEFVDRQGQYHKARGVFLGSDPPGDLSAIKMVKKDLRGARLQPVPLGDSESVHDGAVAVTLSRQGTYLASSTGEIQFALRSQLEAPATQMAVVAMSTTASLPKPATGGALIDSHGRLIGVMGDFYYDAGAAGLTGRQTAVAMGLFKQMVPNLQQANQAAPSSWLGVAGMSLTPSLASAAVACPGRGALIEFVVPRSPADKAGIVAGSRVTTIGGNKCVVGGDVIVGLNGVTIRSFEDLIGALGRIHPGRVVSIRLFRGRSPITLQVRLVPNPTRS